ncbi:MAG: DNA (cytosine-5-)-methyltransferase [Porphyrobacter sp.]|nr:DNA (cytosine-5-)-methyltransferase [Porphyrobacter sp.]
MSRALRKSTPQAYERQAAILRTAEAADADLSAALRSHGISYDDLIYEVSGPQRWDGPAPLSLKDFPKAAAGVPLVSFFTGCGGMDLGFEAVGFDHVAAFEFNELFCKTLRKNRPEWRVYGPPVHSGDVSKFDEVEAALAPLISEPFEGVFVGGPPCQPFSIAANQRFAKWGDNFKRTGFAHEKNGNLLFDFVRLIVRFKPKAFVIENVPGLRDIDSGEQLAAAISDLEAAGYHVHEPTVLNAANYGIPQHRHRLFVVGSRDPSPLFMPPPRNYLVGCGSVLFRSQQSVPNNETRAHKAGSLLRYMRLDYGQRDQLGRVDRLDPSQPSKTVIAGGTAGGGRSHLHPEIPRTLSVRECARLQTFPDEYVFVGPTARQFTQVGNAVPPVLAAQVGSALAQAFFR